MLDYYFIYVELMHSYLETNIPVEKVTISQDIRIQKKSHMYGAFLTFVSERYSYWE